MKINSIVFLFRAVYTSKNAGNCKSHDLAVVDNRFSFKKQLEPFKIYIYRLHNWQGCKLHQM
jgi:hypothetical protein